MRPAPESPELGSIYEGDPKNLWSKMIQYDQIWSNMIKVIQYDQSDLPRPTPAMLTSRISESWEANPQPVKSLSFLPVGQPRINIKINININININKYKYKYKYKAPWFEIYQMITLDRTQQQVLPVKQATQRPRYQSTLWNILWDIIICQL